VVGRGDMPRRKVVAEKGVAVGGMPSPQSGERVSADGWPGTIGMLGPITDPSSRAPPVPLSAAEASRDMEGGRHCVGSGRGNGRRCGRSPGTAVKVRRLEAVAAAPRSVAAVPAPEAPASRLAVPRPAVPRAAAPMPPRARLAASRGQAGGAQAARTEASRTLAGRAQACLQAGGTQAAHTEAGHAQVGGRQGHESDRLGHEPARA
jgi:hypothetical protein